MTDKKTGCFMLQIHDDTCGARYIEPKIKLYGDPVKLRQRLISDPVFVTLIKLPKASHRFNLIPIKDARRILELMEMRDKAV